MGWFKKLTGWSTPKFLKDFDDKVLTPAVSGFAKTNPATNSLYNAGKNIIKAQTQERIKTSEPARVKFYNMDTKANNFFRNSTEEIKKDVKYFLPGKETVPVKENKTDPLIMLLLGVASIYFLKG